MLTQSGVKIWRPRQVYVGSGARDFVESKDRKVKQGEGASVFDAPVEVPRGGDSKRFEIAARGVRARL